MTALLANVTSIVTASVTWITSTVGAVTAEGNELLLLFVLMGFCGVGIGLVRRIIG